MAAEGSYNPATKVLTVTGNGLPTPVTNGTFPNANNANTISPYTFNHAFTYRGGENTSNSGSFSVGIVGIAANGVAIFNPSGGTSGGSAARIYLRGKLVLISLLAAEKIIVAVVLSKVVSILIGTATS